jgi:hypothetical protein
MLVDACHQRPDPPAEVVRPTGTDARQPVEGALKVDGAPSTVDHAQEYAYELIPAGHRPYRGGASGSPWPYPHGRRLATLADRRNRRFQAAGAGDLGGELLSLADEVVEAGGRRRWSGGRLMRQRGAQALPGGGGQLGK